MKSDVRINQLIKRHVPGLIKDTIKNAVWHLGTRHSNSWPPILLFTSRRSGGTWLAEVLSRQKGVLFVNEPTETGKYDHWAIRRGVFPANILSQGGIPVSEEDTEWVISFFRKIIEGKIRIQSPWNPFRPTFHFRTDRVLIKTHVTKPYIEEICLSFPKALVIWLVRHPIPQARSARRVGSRITAGTYLQIPKIRRELSEEQHRASSKVLEDGDLDELMLLDWCLENLIPARRFNSIPNGILVSYEELVIDREHVFELLAEKCGFVAPWDPERHDGPSASTRGRGKARAIQDALRGDTEARRTLIESWVDSVQPRIVGQCQRLLDVFEIDLYTGSRPMIRDAYRLAFDTANRLSNYGKE